MPLRFGTAASDRVQIPASTSLNSLGTHTVAMWLRPNASGLSGGLVAKGVAAGASRRSFELDNTTAANSFLGLVDLSTTDARSVAAAGTIVNGLWQCVAMLYDDSTKVISLYWGSLVSPLAEVTYAVQTTGSGTTASNNANNQMIGVFGGGTSGSANQTGAAVAIWGQAIPLPVLRQWQYDVRPIGPNLLGLWRLGANGRGLVLDESGNNNHGTITGVIPTNDYLPRMCQRIVA